MKALVYHGAREQRFEDSADPVLEAGEALIKVEAVGICGSDMHAWEGHDDRRPPPLILGHEAAGTIVDGNGTSFSVGQRVTVNPLVTCMECSHCKSGRENLCQTRQIISMPPRQGAFSQLLRMPARNLAEIPNSVAVEHAALAEPIACSYHAVRLADHALHSSISEAKALVIGGGAIGLSAALVLQQRGCRNVTISEPNETRHPLIKASGEFRVSMPDALIDGELSSFDLVVDAYGGDPTRKAASALAKEGGVIAHIGLAGGSAGLDIRRMTLQEITFIGTYTYTMQDFRETAQLIFDGKLGALDWVEHRDLADGQGGFEDIASGRASYPKIMLHP